MFEKLRFSSCLMASTLLVFAACGDSGSGTATDAGTETDTDTDTTSNTTQTSNTTDPTTVGPTTDPSTTDSTTTDPSTTDPSTTDPSTTDPSTTDPSTTDPSTTDPSTSTTDPSTTGTTGENLCGNGEIDDGEDCDDGNADNTDECTELCAAPACDDGIMSGLETDVDCGGPDCGIPCGDNLGCLNDLDCESMVCDPDNNICLAAACDDGVLNGNEEQVDCGGDCDPCPDPKFVINEVDYDQPGGDTAEFLELYNGTMMDIPLAGMVVVLINGSNNQVYGTIDLTDAGMTLPAGEYLVIGVQPVLDTLPQDTLSIARPNNFVQNGAPDGIVLVDLVKMEVVDSVAYEGDITGIMFMGLGPFDLESAQDADINDDVGSLARLPNGFDNDMPTDWSATMMPTPGAENM